MAKLKLETGNIKDYLNSLGIFKNVDWEKVKVSEVTEHTNVNYVYVVNLDSSRYKKIYIKQAFDYVKIAPDFPAPIERQEFEKLSIDYLQNYWKGRIPEVVHYDKPNDVLIITDVGEGADLLAEEIKQGKLHFEVGSDLGSMMTELHAPTYDKSEFPVRNKKANDEHVDFIFDFRLRGSKETLPKETDTLFKESQGVKTSMIYGDWASKNVFVAEGKVRLVDFENLVRFDPAFDLGYALAHWALEISEENRSKMVKFFDDFEQSYSKSQEGNFQKDTSGILKRASRYVGAMMLHRVAGVKNTNRLEYYLSRDIPIIEISKRLIQNSYQKPSVGIKSVSLE